MAPDDPASATLDEWRKVEAEMQAGHEIRDGGKPFTLFDAAPPLRAPGPRGAGLCACGAASGRLQSDVGRRRWHGEHLDSLGIGHKAVARVMLDRRKAEEAPMARDPDPASATLTAIRDEALGSIAYAGNHACPDAGSSCSAHNALRLLAAVEAAWALAANAQVVRAAITAALTGDSESEPPQAEADRRAADEALEALRAKLAGEG